MRRDGDPFIAGGATCMAMACALLVAWPDPRAGLAGAALLAGSIFCIVMALRRD